MQLVRLFALFSEHCWKMRLCSLDFFNLIVFRHNENKPGLNYRRILKQFKLLVFVTVGVVFAPIIVENDFATSEVRLNFSIQSG